MPPSPAFTSRISDTFGARVSSLSFGAPSSITTINDWVSAATNARIPKIVSQFDAGTVAMLINATWFKGKWRAQFDPQKTHSAPFNVTASSTVPVSLMFNETGLVRTATLRNGTVVGELPYGGDAFVMDVLMPPVGQLESFVDSLTPAVWTSAIAALPDSARGMSVSLPKFRLETSRELKQDLAALGMPRAFGDAQLAPMFAAGGAGTSVSSVRQRVFVDVNEEGTEAAAVTSVTIVVTSIQQAFSVDRPFLFAIRERLTGTILFLGKVVRPVAP
jgi:serpin B